MSSQATYVYCKHALCLARPCHSLLLLPLTSQFKGDIVLSHVDFRYPTRRGRVLRDFNLHIKAGQTVALVGPSGSGKSTIVQLLQRFYDPLKGSGGITIDGTPLQDINVRWLRSKIGVVSQEPTLFQGTIKGTAEGCGLASWAGRCCVSPCAAT